MWPAHSLNCLLHSARNALREKSICAALFVPHHFYRQSALEGALQHEPLGLQIRLSLSAAPLEERVFDLREVVALI